MLHIQPLQPHLLHLLMATDVRPPNFKEYSWLCHTSINYTQNPPTGAGISGSFACLGSHGTGGYGVCWEDVGVVPDVVGDHGIGGFDPSAANCGAYAGLVHGITSRSKSKPKTPAAPTTGGPPQPHPPNPQDPFAKAPGAISPTLDMQGTVC